MAQPIAVQVNEEFRTCPECGYQNGFHVAFQREGQGAAVAVRLVCPSCSVAFDLGLRITIERPKT